MKSKKIPSTLGMRFITIFCVILALLTGFSFSAYAVTAESTHTPWSGYWWPYYLGGLATGADYRGHPAPLEKYLMFTTGLKNGSLITWYKNRYYDPDAEGWFGLCPYWARSSVMETYDILPSSEDNIVFRVGDKKGLLTLCHDGDLKITGSGSDPMTFHRWLLDYIHDQKKSFTADLDPGTEVWFYPVYRYEMSTSKSGLVESVSVSIFYADDNVRPDYMGTRKLKKEYTYNLDVNLSGAIVGGEWTGNSVTDHPDTLIFPLTSAALCPDLDSGEVRRIAQAKDDFLEAPGNAAVSIIPGTYHLILMNEDQYIVDGLSGDKADVIFTQENSSVSDINIKIFDASDTPVMSDTLKNEGSMNYRLNLQNPPYTVVLSQDTYDDPNIYTLTMDLKTDFHRDIPYVPKSGEWSGFALTNAGDDVAEDVMLVTEAGDGTPIQTVYGPINLAPGEKKTFIFDELPWRIHEYGETEALELISHQPVDVVNLFAHDQKAMAGFGQSAASGSHLVIPDTYYEVMGSSRYMKGAVYNHTDINAPVTFCLYSVDGVLTSEISDVILSGTRYPITLGADPFYQVSDGGWIDVVSTNSVQLSGYQYIKDRAGKTDAIETLFALPVGTKSKIVPHITEPTGRWITYLTLINPNDRTNTINLHLLRAGGDQNEDLNLVFEPFEKRILDLSADFGKFEGDALYRSVLEIKGQYPIAGYFKYSPSNGGDAADYPLMDAAMLKPELILPHYAGREDRWWTGAGICNPNDYPVQVSAQPFDDAGNAMDVRESFINLEPGAYSVFTIRSIFGDDASDIAFIKFYADTPEDAPIGGFYLYGKKNKENKFGFMTTLSGSIM